MRPKLTAVFLAVLTILTCAVTPAQAAAARRDPVVLIHGYNSSPATWNKLVGRLKAAGYDAADIHPFGYNYRLSNVTTAALLAGYIAKIDSPRVDIVAHSMGAVMARYYLKNLGGTAQVDELISLAGPHHGTRTLVICSFDPSCRELLPGSSFLRALNAGDETPGPVRYRTFRSPCDLIVIPNSSASLTGAENTDAGCVGHTEFRLVDSIATQIIKELQD